MAIRYYDEALLNKIKGWVRDPNMHILGTDESTRLFQIEAVKNDDKPLTLPLIALSRDANMEILSTQKKALTYDGGHLAMDRQYSEILNAIPIQLNYQLDIYTKYFAEADEYVRNFVFNFINYPKLHIELPYNGANIVHDSNIFVEPTVSDNSNIPERLIIGQFTRMTIRLTVDDAYLFSIPFMDNWRIDKNSNLDVVK